MGTAATLNATLAAASPDFAAHSTRVTELALRLASALEVDGEIEHAIRVGGPVHDVGKLAVSEEVLTKPGALEPHELAEIRAHPTLGARMLAGVKGVRAGLTCVLHHHERWDGDGYPSGLAGEAIPLEARIVSVADAYDAMTSDRPYRAALSRSEALAEVGRCIGTQFDPVVAGALLQLVS